MSANSKYPEWLRRQPLLQPIRRLRARRRRARLRGPRVIAALADAFPQLNFVQIGSNDGQKHDPIHATVMAMEAWRGVMVEPVPYVFKRLLQTYHAMPRISLENVAIARHSGTQPFYHLEEAEDRAGLPDWYDELGSFFKDVVLKHRDAIPDIEQRLKTTEVPCLRLDDLCRRHDLQPLGLVHIDTEGYDFEIIKSMDFAGWRPRLLIYEHKHLGTADSAACLQLLQQHGYRCFAEGQDTWCVDMRRDDPAHLQWLVAIKRVLG